MPNRGETTGDVSVPTSSPSFVTLDPASGSASPSIWSVFSRFGGFAPTAASASEPTFSVPCLTNRSSDTS